MRRQRIGWYVHHHGSGHLMRFLAIRPHLDADVVCFSTLDEPAGLPPGTSWVRLDRDDESETSDRGREVDPAMADPTVGGLLHWAPLGHGGHRSRLGRIAVETLRAHLDVFVVDVSVEVTVFVRLLGVPVVLVAQPGLRTDRAHALAYASATRILAPWPSGLVPQSEFGAATDVVFSGGISRFDGRPRRPEQDRSGVVVLLGSGGDDVPPGGFEALFHTLPDDVTLLGSGHAWLDDPWSTLSSASVVVSWAGQNSVADLAAAGARAVVIPQRRPFDEQRVTASALADAGLATVEDRWPDSWRWPDVIDEARSLEPRWSLWQTDGAARRAARAILETAAKWAA